MSSDSRHLIFSDESGWDNDNRYGSLAMISGTFENTKALNYELKAILDSNRKKEIRFKKIKNRDSVNIADTFLKVSFEYLIACKIKVHVLVWDKKDSRHNVIGRCDIENLKRMYYKNMMVLKRHWNISTTWEFYPDEFTAIEWESDIISYLQNTSLQKKDVQPQLFNAFEKVHFPNYTHVKELESNKFAIIQLADLYAGLIRTSRSESENFTKWYSQKQTVEQPVLFRFNEKLTISNSLVPKFELMFKFKKKADSLKMGIRLNDKKYFSKPHKKNNLFIWHYEPQGEYDKAPTRIK